MTDTIKKLKAKVESLAQMLDDQLGTPCEQVRHQQEIEQLQTKIERLRNEKIELLNWLNTYHPHIAIEFAQRAR